MWSFSLLGGSIKHTWLSMFSSTTQLRRIQTAQFHDTEDSVSLNSCVKSSDIWFLPAISLLYFWICLELKGRKQVVWDENNEFGISLKATSKTWISKFLQCFRQSDFIRERVYFLKITINLHNFLCFKINDTSCRQVGLAMKFREWNESHL